ncbi:oxidoreductase C-terminal domain-containing protein [Nonomuraea sp. NPDC052129]|uniref:oxidoreductase C-terminal domain-containing protein n=1 Tax=Nonomuraea sp. NPDC052129 TaxID=3154651 RepID=UPI0034202547
MRLSDGTRIGRGDVQTHHFAAFWLRGGRVPAGTNVNIWDVNDAIQDLVRSGERVDTSALGDAETPLGSLVGASPKAGDG